MEVFLEHLEVTQPVALLVDAFALPFFHVPKVRTTEPNHSRASGGIEAALQSKRPTCPAQLD